MFYIFYAIKFKNHKGKSPLCALLQKFNKRFVNDDIIVCLPGFMSRTKKTIHDYCSNLNLQSTQRVSFLEGMNGKHRVRNQITSIQDEHNAHFNGVMNCLSNDTDHSKMIFYLMSRYDGDGLNDYINLCIATNDTIQGIEVKAVLIGSSNQSYKTYFGPIADYGESDIFIINSSFYDDSFENELVQLYDELPNDIKENIVLAKEIRGCTNLLNEIWEKSIKH